MNLTQERVLASTTSVHLSPLGGEHKPRNVVIDFGCVRGLAFAGCHVVGSSVRLSSAPRWWLFGALP